LWCLPKFTIHQNLDAKVYIYWHYQRLQFISYVHQICTLLVYRFKYHYICDVYQCQSLHLLTLPKVTIYIVCSLIISLLRLNIITFVMFTKVYNSSKSRSLHLLTLPKVTIHQISMPKFTFTTITKFAIHQISYYWSLLLPLPKFTSYPKFTLSNTGCNSVWVEPINITISE
jgi:hypothetical protein